MFVIDHQEKVLNKYFFLVIYPKGFCYCSVVCQNVLWLIVGKMAVCTCPPPPVAGCTEYPFAPMSWYNLQFQHNLEPDKLEVWNCLLRSETLTINDLQWKIFSFLFIRADFDRFFHLAPCPLLSRTIFIDIFDECFVLIVLIVCLEAFCLV